MFNAITVEATFHLAHAIKQQLNSQLETQKLGIAAMHVRVLKVIGKSNSSTAIDIAGLFKRDKAQITRLVNQLIDQGFVQKTPNPDDKRSQLLELTSAGRALQERLRTLSDDMENQMAQGIEAEDLDTFTKVAQKMTRNLASQ
ncbi:MAG: MarR family transcriptional regulator [Marinobacter sp.]|uniref:MarR family winged helix-turn-helix transcriptional regulator n=1 Tax=Marinobacter sp. AC-23 TaxID=1879031 RepID=UPI0008DD1034|nr:MarR family transcriptional regulator [Marinobacter sp. AC-23]OHY81118.1 MarR family transcriptional regulator [Marinobacter sp. AC-23]